MISGKEQQCCVKESVYLDPKQYGGAIPIVWMKVVFETEVNCEKRLPEVLLYTRDVRQSKKYICDDLLSYQSMFGLLHMSAQLHLIPAQNWCRF